eukprot:1148857-Prymnesium_polylepis.1
MHQYGLPDGATQQDVERDLSAAASAASGYRVVVEAESIGGLRRWITRRGAHAGGSAVAARHNRGRSIGDMRGAFSGAGRPSRTATTGRHRLWVALRSAHHSGRAPREGTTRHCSDRAGSARRRLIGGGGRI